MRRLSCVRTVANLFREKERRFGQSKFVHGEACFRDEHGQLSEAVVCELSDRSCSIVTDCRLNVGDRLHIGVVGMSDIDATVISDEGDRYCCQFSAIVPSTDWFALGTPLIRRIAQDGSVRE